MQFATIVKLEENLFLSVELIKWVVYLNDVDIGVSGIANVSFIR